MIRQTLAAGSATVALLACAAARAQSGEMARADALFNAGKELRDAGQWADACPNFAESKRLAPGVGISLYLADCYEHIGRPSNAYQEFREAERLARERNDKRADTAHTRALALESKLGGLLIEAPTAAAGEAPEVLLDGARVPPEQWNIAMTVDPGDHVVTITARGQPPRLLKAHVDAGYRPTTVQIEQTAPTPPAATPAAPPPTEAPAAESDTGRTMRTGAGVALTTVGVVGIGIGTWLAATAPSPQPSCVPPPEDNRPTAEAIAYAVGAATLISGIIVLAFNPHKSTTGMTISPMTLTSGAGALLRTDF